MSITTITDAEEIKKITFPGQYPDEQILLIKRRHYLVILGLVFVIILLALVPIIVYFGLPFILALPDTQIFISLLLFISGLYYLFLSVISFSLFIDYYLDIWIITDQRIISIEQKGLFRRTVTELRYGQIQDITSDVSGLIATYFQFGNVRIQTAAEEERMILRQVTHPIETRRVISDAYRKATENTEIKKPAL